MAELPRHDVADSSSLSIRHDGLEPGRSGFAPPTISLPKGGGAIRGLGEKFSASPSGAATLVVPVPVPPGRDGFAPSLSLGYDSGAGNGPFGLGWHLSVPSIARKTERRLPRYYDAKESDTYLLSDAEDLTPALDLVDGVWKPVVRVPDVPGFRIRAYRPRVEAGFARIERWVESVSGVAHWVVVTPGNVTSVFGRSAAARIADPDDPRRVFRWLLEETFDDRGNVIVYEYKQEDGASVDRSGSYESTRRLGPQGCANRYLKAVRYGNQTAFARTGWHFHVVFDYGEHDTKPSDTEIRPWSGRPDAFSSFRSGFEIRTRRLCRRILCFHQFPGEESFGEAPLCVRSVEFEYDENPALAQLVSITQTGYRTEGTTSSALSLPPLEFEYTKARRDETVRTADPVSLESLPSGVDNDRYHWVDLDGEGLSGVLTEQDGAWLYKRNLGSLGAGDGGSARPRLGALEVVARKPSLARLGQSDQRLMDVAGDGGLSVVVLGRDVQGYQERSENGWHPFVPFTAAPNVDWRDPNLLWIDLDGDGRADVLVSEEEVFRWYPSLGRDGFAPAEIEDKPPDEEQGARLVFAEAERCLFIADMTGDGLHDLVRIRTGEVVYWPNLGHGRFGAKVTMAGAPVLDAPDGFRADRIRLADVDGSGPTDLIYLGADGAQLWQNQAGNSFGEARPIRFLPPHHALASVAVVDLLGRGTACLVWSSPLPGDGVAPLRYLDLMGGVKPHLLAHVRNNLGAETSVSYSPSTRFYADDRQAGQPWATKLPFPVHVVERVEAADLVTGTRLVSRYRYRHGYYDRREREFRGFALVEHWDSESFLPFNAPAPTGSGWLIGAGAMRAPPAHTRTWYHTGAWPQPEVVRATLAAEFAPTPPVHLPPPLLPDSLPAGAEAEAFRALKGTMLRQEVYGLDGTPAASTPYRVVESRPGLVLVQPPLDGCQGVFAPYTAETLTAVCEREVENPRLVHTLTVEVDPFATATRTVTVAYPRPGTGEPEQLRPAVTCAETDVFHHAHDANWYRLGVPVEARTYELIGLPPPGIGLYDFATVRTVAASAPGAPFESPPAIGKKKQKRLLARIRTTYYRDDLAGPLAAGEVESLALPYETLTLALTDGLVDAAFSGRVSATMLASVSQGGYRPGGGAWWIPSGRPTHDAAHFYHRHTVTDAFGNESSIAYDPYDLCIARVTDPLGNIVRADHDYQTLQPRLSVDANGNRSAVRIDSLGRVVATAVMGAPGKDEGDTLDDPTSRVSYNLDEWSAKRRPVYALTESKETHGPGARRLRRYSYSDGRGRQVMEKVQAEPGLAPGRDAGGRLLHGADGRLVLANTSPALRWVGTGRTVFDDKGNPVKQYEPYFSSTPAYEDEAELVETGFTPVHRHDALGRVVRTDRPNGTFSRLELSAWKQTTFDENDTATKSSWFAERIGPASTLPDAERAAAARTASAQGAAGSTPTTTHLDPLGRAFLTVLDNGPLGRAPTRLELDIEGNVRRITDAAGHVVEQTFGPHRSLLRKRGSDIGSAWQLRAVDGKPLQSWDGRGASTRQLYDALRRITHLFTVGPAATLVEPTLDGEAKTAPETLAERTVYGEAKSAAGANLRGRVLCVYDGAGAVITDRYDFKGNVLESRRQFTREYRSAPDWKPLAELDDATAIATAAAVLLSPEVFPTITTYDALERPMTTTTWDGSVATPKYNEAGLLESLVLSVRGGSARTFVSNIDYDAKGRRESVVYGDKKIVSSFEFDPITSRLSHLRTTSSKDGAKLQDLFYTYDPVGNVMEIRDDAQQTIFFRRRKVDPSTRYSYDALYRLSEATGREQVGLTATGAQALPAQPERNDLPRTGLIHPGDGEAMAKYRESYVYDSVGNLLEVAHSGDGGGWRRSYRYVAGTNRLKDTNAPGDGPSTFSAAYAHDDNGNMIAMPHHKPLDYDARNRLVRVDLGGGGNAYYLYDARGNRVRKVVERVGTLVDERLYLDDLDVSRRRVGGSLKRERQTLHVMDGASRVALVETVTVDEENASGVGTSAIRFQHGNHLGSAVLELDHEGAVISYEEYHPYGSTAYQAGSSKAEISLKRYRYTGKERDDETGLCYHGARYYAPWLARWISCDPAGTADGINPYAYARNRPLNRTDPTGTQSTSSSALGVDELKANPDLAMPPVVLAVVGAPIVASPSSGKGVRDPGVASGTAPQHWVEPLGAHAGVAVPAFWQTHSFWEDFSPAPAPPSVGQWPIAEGHPAHKVPDSGPQQRDYDRLNTTVNPPEKPSKSDLSPLMEAVLKQPTVKTALDTAVERTTTQIKVGHPSATTIAAVAVEAVAMVSLISAGMWMGAPSKTGDAAGEINPRQVVSGLMKLPSSSGLPTFVPGIATPIQAHSREEGAVRSTVAPGKWIPPFMVFAQGVF